MSNPNYQQNPPQNPLGQQPYSGETIMDAAVKKNMSGYFHNKTNTITAIILAVFIGIMLSFLVVEYRLRINVFVFYTLLLAVTGYIMYRDDNLAIKPFIFLSASFLAIASVFMRFSFEGYIAIAVLLLPVIYVIITVYASKQKYLSEVRTILFRGVCTVGFIHMIIVALGSLKGSGSTKKKYFLHILIGVGITVALLTVIIPLMISADEMFKVKLTDIFGSANIGTFILKSILSAFIAMLLFGFFYLITAHRLKEKTKAQHSLPSVTAVILTIIIILAVIFTFFAVVQFGYLFIGATSDLPDGFSYAQYARDGYFQLVVLSVINFVIILTCVQFSKNGSKNARRAIKIILAYFNALNIYLLVSAAYKMSLYQNEFGLTTSRLLVYILLGFEAVLILGLMVKIFLENLKFIKLAIYYSVAFLALASFVNVESIALKSNINRFYGSDKFDFGYIETLSPDASRTVYDFFLENHDELSEDELDSIENYFGFNDYIIEPEQKQSRDDEFFGLEDYTVITLTPSEYKERYRLENWREYNIAQQTKYRQGLELLEQYYK